MRREETIELEAVAEKCVASLERRPLYFEQSRARGAEGPVFGWYHSTPAALQSDCAAVICGPIGHEYTRSHRAIRHLADRLAERGIPALRFDYHGIGDSPGGELDPDRVAFWQASIRAAIRQARALSGRQRVCLIGVRLGGLLAALVASDMPVDLLVLWNVPAKGKAYVRELQAIAMAAARDPQASERGLESAGFTMSPQTLDALRKVDLARNPAKAGRVLLVGRDDLAPDSALAELFKAQGVSCDTVRVPGWLGMMADHQFTVVPDEALDAVSDWVAGHVDARMTAPAPARDAETRVNRFVHETLAGGRTRLQEEACLFGAGKHLFGVLTHGGSPGDHPVVLLANAGAIHHVGPNRLYVTLARELAAKGFAAFRFDLESLGDSVLRGPGRENYPYPDNAVDDVRSAIRFLRARGYRRFIVAGMCSGAHTAFHAGLQVDDPGIEELVLVNPWEFYWVEGMSLDDNSHFVQAAAYRSAMKDPNRWMKLLRGQVDVRRAVRFVTAHASTRLKAIALALGVGEEPRLSRDLKRLLRDRHVAIYFSQGEPGCDILMHDARRTTQRAMNAGRLDLEIIPGADHIFSDWTARRDILQRLVDHFAMRYAVVGTVQAREARPAALKAA
ncbi:MAG TPA: alpha/beta hydrolase [Usitatibacter sp.]|jgi:alpha-beta hydrolase superfamily lysophospholipase|nr:alpha/beta hydrolase [Usitatibacter sp.]